MLANALTLALFAGAAVAKPCSKPATAASYSTVPSPTSSAAADPTSTIVRPGEAFNILALRSASPIHFAQTSAALNSIFLNLPAQNATCDDGTKPIEQNYATFFIADDGSLELWRHSATPQWLYVDRSGMGQGKLGYTTGAQPAPRNGERTKWEIDQYGDLTFNGAGFIACPDSIDGAWSVWVDAGVVNPGGNKDCLGFSARTVKSAETANSCDYSQQQ
ncbi:hypothetical protein F4808DRAFT_280185 [Astrocystis sublimbata]|nr:hypothetical protein F4808DRAFT_280185 [Astrocystis sublimbata]